MRYDDESILLGQDLYKRLKRLRSRFIAQYGKRVPGTRYRVGDFLFARPRGYKRCMIILDRDGTVFSYSPRLTLMSTQVLKMDLVALRKDDFYGVHVTPNTKEEILPLFDKTLNLEFLLEYYQKAVPIRINLLAAYIHRAREAYYAQTKPGRLTDTEYDTMMEMLESIDPDNPELSRTGVRESEVDRKSSESIDPTAREVKLPVHAPSLTKLKPGDGSTTKWVHSLVNTGEASSDDKVVVTTKLDGVSILLRYIKGRLVKAYTRGDGKVGTDFTRKAKFINAIPKQIPVKTPLIVRGELILAEPVFLKYFAKDFKNARNLVSSIRTAHNPDKFLLDKVDFLAFSIPNRNDVPKDKQLVLLKKLGFKIPKAKVTRLKHVNDKNLLKLDKLLRVSQSTYAADGIVVELADTSKSQELQKLDSKKNPVAARAFKPPTEAKDALVKGIEWNVTKEGFVNPTVLIKPVKLSGVTVSRAAGKNAKTIKELGIGPGAIVSITRSGDVIPDILSTIKPVKPQLPASCPRCEMKLAWVGSEKTGGKTNLQCPNPQCPGRVEKQIKHFFTALNIKNVSEKTAALLMRNGYDSIDKLMAATVDDLVEIPGVGKTKAKQILVGLVKGITNAYLYDLMYASGYFGGLLGRRRLKAICQHFGKPGILSFRKMTKQEIVQEIRELPGFDNKTARVFADSIKPFLNWVLSSKTLKKALNRIAPKKKPGSKASALYGKSVVFTGFRDDALKKAIEEAGGDVKSSVSRKTDIVVTVDLGKITGKLRKARDYGIPVMLVDEFKVKYGLP